MTTAGPRSARPSADAAAASSTLLYDSALPWSGGALDPERAVVDGRAGAPIARGRLVRVLPVAQRLDLLERERVSVGGIRVLGRIEQAGGDRAGPGSSGGDPGVVGGGVGERLERQLAPQPFVERALAVERREHVRDSAPATVTIATLAWFLAAARTIDGPPMSISSISSSTVMPGRSSAAANG